jgi:nucleotide-binding universal stress UspA family protein
LIEFKQIICPVDFSESSVRAFAHAVAIAQWYDAQLTVLHVVPSFDPVQVRGDLTDPVRVVTPYAKFAANWPDQLAPCRSVFVIDGRAGGRDQVFSRADGWCPQHCGLTVRRTEVGR